MDRIALICALAWLLGCSELLFSEDFVTHMALFFQYRESVNMLAGPMPLNNAPTMTSSRSWPYFDPEYDTMSSIIDPPK